MTGIPDWSGLQTPCGYLLRANAVASPRLGRHNNRQSSRVRKNDAAPVGSGSRGFVPSEAV